MSARATLVRTKIEKGDVLTEFEKSYFSRRLRNNIFIAVAKAYEKALEEEGLTKAEIASRLNKKPSQITRWLSGPGNWTFDTVSQLLLAMGAELKPQVRYICDIPQSNFQHDLAGQPVQQVQRSESGTLNKARQAELQTNRAGHETGTRSKVLEFNLG